MPAAQAPLPRSLEPLPDESLPGFLLRLTHRLDLTPHQLARRVTLIPPDDPHAKVSPGTSADDAVSSPARLRRSDPDDHRGRRRADAQALRRPLPRPCTGAGPPGKHSSPPQAVPALAADEPF